MKKLFALLTTACITSAVQAGAIAWRAANVQSAPSGIYVGGVTTYSAYLYIVSTAVTLDSIKNYLDSGNITAAGAAASASKTSVATSTEPPVMGFTGGDPYGSFSGSVSAFMIIMDAATMADADYYLVSLENGTGSAVLTQDIDPKIDQNYAWGNQASNTAWQEIGAVPEPASMSLLLVGLAGIGLRRKLKKAKKAA